MSKEIDPGEGYVLTTEFQPGLQYRVNDEWFITALTCQNDMKMAMFQGRVYRRKLTSEELKAQAAKKVPSLGTAYDGSPMDLDWFINSLKPLCELGENETGIVKLMGLRSFVNNLMFKKKDQQL